MPTWLAILIGAALLAVAIYAGAARDRYAISTVPGGDGHFPTAWRLDRVTGKADLCYFERNPFDGPKAARDVKCAASLVPQTAPP